MRVIIIGAGAAGLGAARMLADEGVPAVVLEARDRVGGRAWTAYDLGPYPVEQGAEFIVGTEALTWKYLERYGMNAIDVTSGYQTFFHLDGRLWSPETYPGTNHGEILRRLYLASLEHQQTGRPDISMAKALESIIPALGYDVTDEERRFWNNAIAQWMSADLDNLSLLARSEYGISDESEGANDHFRLVNGYSTLWSRMSGDLDIRLNTPVSHVRWNDHGVTVTANGEEFKAERLISTLPLGVLKAGDVVFDPPLPDEKQDAIDGLGAGHVDKIIVRFTDRFWPDDLGYVFTHLDSQLWWTPGFNRENPPPILTGFFAGRSAEHFESLGNNAPSVALRDLEAMYDIPLQDKVEEARFIAWGADPYSKMGYSHARPGKLGLRPKLAAPVGDRLFFAGEASNLHHPSMVHGALETGERAAGEVLAVIGG